MRKGLLTSTAMAAVFFVTIAPAHAADTCVDLRTGQQYDCDKQPPAPAKQPPSAAAQPAPAGRPDTEALRNQLSRNLAAPSTTTVDPVAVGLAQKAEDASHRAESALVSAGLTNDPAEKAQFRGAYEKARAELRTSMQQLIAATSDPAKKQNLAKALQDSEARQTQMAAEAGLGGPAKPVPTQQAAATESRPEVFTICDAPDKGITRCQALGKTGSACQVVLYQGRDIHWRDPAMSICSEADMKLRDAYFAGKPVAIDSQPAGPADSRAQQIQSLLASLPPNCQAQMQNYLYGSQESKKSREAGQTAAKSFAEMDLECKAGLVRLSDALGVQSPQRRVVGGSQRVWTGAMADKPRETVNVPNTDNYGYAARSPDSNGGDWNTGEVIDAGIQIMGVLGAILGGVASGYATGGGGGGGYTYTSRPAGAARTYGQGSPSGTGYVYRQPAPACAVGGKGWCTAQ